MSDVETKHCPVCAKDLPIDRFGICRARRDGRNLYCKLCISAKVTAQRRALKEYKAIRKQYRPKEMEYYEEGFSTKPQVRPLSKLSPVERVKEAIQNGARTQTAIAYQTKLDKDSIGDAIANLLLWTKEIRTQIVGDARMYFINEVQLKSETATYPVVARKANRIEIKRERRTQKVA